MDGVNIKPIQTQVHTITHPQLATIFLYSPFLLFAVFLDLHKQEEDLELDGAIWSQSDLNVDTGVKYQGVNKVKTCQNV